MTDGTQPQDLGEFKTVDNDALYSKLQSKELVVGWITLDGDLVPMALTKGELRRPLERAKDNKEDLPVLGAKPPSHEQFNKVHDEADRLRKENEFLKSRGLFARLFNTQPNKETD